MLKSNGLSDKLIKHIIIMVRNDVADWLGTDTVVGVELVRVNCTLLNYVLQMRIAAGGRVFDVYVKTSGEGDLSQVLADEYQRTVALSEHFVEAQPGLNSVQIIAYHDEPQMLVLLGALGDTLLDAMRCECRLWHTGSIQCVTQRANMVGHWVKQLENSSVEVGNGRDVHLVMMRTAREAAQRIDRCGFASGLRETAEQCVRIIEAATDAAANEPTYLAHGDLHPQNILITDDQLPRVTVIDAALSRPQWLGFDALTFAHHIAFSFRPPRYRLSFLKNIIAGFNEGYGCIPDENSAIANAIRAALTLNSLAYLASIANRFGIFRKCQCHMDARVLTRYVATQLVQNSDNAICA